MSGISVIVCCYNPDIGKLEKTLNSIINQINVNFEIIIADDCSKDDIKAAVENYTLLNHITTSKIKYSIQKKNCGTIINLRSALELCDYDYYKVISPGDYFFDRQSLATYYDVLSQGKYDLVYSDAIYYNNHSIVKNRRYPTSRLNLNESYLKRNYIKYKTFFLGATIGAKVDTEKEILDIVKNRVLYLEDLSTVTFMILRDKKIKGINKPLMWYEFDTGITGSNNMSGRMRIQNDTNMVKKIALEQYPSMDYEIDINKYKNKYSLFLNNPKLFLIRIAEKVFKAKEYNCSIEQLDDITSLKK